jgi:hypothetical protein
MFREVILCMASEGGLIATGQLYLQQGTHGVTTFLRQPTGPEGKHFQISLIIIRMTPEGPQQEGFGCGSSTARLDGRSFDHLTSLRCGRSSGSGLGTSPA